MNHAPADHDQHDEDRAIDSGHTGHRTDNDHPGHRESLVISIRASIKATHEDTYGLRSVLIALDDNDHLLAFEPVRRDTTRLTLASAYRDRMIRVFHVAELAENIKPTAARLRRLNAVEQRIPVRPGIEFSFPPIHPKWWRRSCCRVRGKVVMR